MIASELTIKLPKSMESRRRALNFLLRHGLISKREASKADAQKTIPKPPNPKKSRWAKVAEELSQENLLANGLGEELRKYMNEFREGFAFKTNVDPKPRV